MNIAPEIEESHASSKRDCPLRARRDWQPRHWGSMRGVTYQINGGWAVDALIGHQTREHVDLDVLVDAGFVPDMLTWLEERGQSAIEDWRPLRIETASPIGRVDVHPMTID